MREAVQDWVEARDGAAIRVRGWPAPVPTSMVLVIHHGLGEHGGRYDTFARELADEPLHIWTYDCRGHGDTAGPRGHADGLSGLAADLDQLLPALLERAGADEAVLYGHSMGAAVVATYLTRHSPHAALRGVWMSAPPTRVSLTVEMRIKALAARVLSRAVPRLTLGSGLPATGISSVPAEVARYTSDPLVHDRISARLGYSLLRDAPALIEAASSITLPALLWHGAGDPIADRRGTEDLFARLGSTDRTLEIVDDALHEVHHETPEVVARLFGLLRDWLRGRGLA